MICKTCGAELRQDAKFCSQCGNSVEQPTSFPEHPKVPTEEPRKVTPIEHSDLDQLGHYVSELQRAHRSEHETTKELANTVIGLQDIVERLTKLVENHIADHKVTESKIVEPEVKVTKTEVFFDKLWLWFKTH